jgi:hypothetical protein
MNVVKERSIIMVLEGLSSCLTCRELVFARESLRNPNSNERLWVLDQLGGNTSQRFGLPSGRKHAEQCRAVDAGLVGGDIE